MTHSALLKRLEAGEVSVEFVARELQLSVDETRMVSRTYRILREEAAERRRDLWRWTKVVALFAVLPLGFTASVFCSRAPAAVTAPGNAPQTGGGSTACNPAER